MSKNRKRSQLTKLPKHLLIINVLLVVLVLIGVGYSILSTTLHISGDILVKAPYPILKAVERNDTYAFRSDTYRSKIKTITLSNTINPPANVVASWDVGYYQNGNVMAYIVRNSSDNTMYDLYIQGNGGLYANENSSYLFYNFPELTQINNLTVLDTSLTKNMYFIFAAIPKVSTLNLSNFNTSQVTSMEGMFAGYILDDDIQVNMNLNQITGITNFDTSKVTTMQNMFLNLNNIQTLDLSSFNTSKVTNMDSMFNNSNDFSSKLETIILGDSFETSNVTNMTLMFADNPKLSTVDLSNFDTSKVTSMDKMFVNCAGFKTINLSSFNTSQVTNMVEMFNNLNDLSSQLETIIFGSNFDTSNVTSMLLMFADNPKLASLDVSGFNTAKVTSMSGMFANCASLKSINLTNFNTSNVVYMQDMFNNTNDLSSQLETITFGSGFNTSNVVNMSTMFADNPKLSSLDLSTFNTSNVTNMNYMFSNDSSLKTLRISNFTFNNVTTSTHFAYNMPTRANGAKVYVKNTAAQNWILNLGSGNRPSDWTTANVLIQS